jgi:hypothetical protein
MINHSRRIMKNPISTRAQAAAVAHSLARLCRLPRVRKVNGLDLDHVAGLGKLISRFHAGRCTAISPTRRWRLTAVGVIFYFSSALSH